MGISAGVAALIAGGLGAAGSITGGILGSNAAHDAASLQAQSAQQGIDLQKQIFEQQQQNQAPFIAAGNQSLSQLMAALSSGKFGAGSTGTAPKFEGGTFTAPTLQDAQNTPGYQFTAQQGSKSILQGAAAAGGAISGGTLKSLANYNTGLADSTYNDVFNRSLSTYNAGLSKYQADLQGFGAGLQANQQEFNQTFAPAQLGENAVASINNTGSVAGANISSLIGQQGNALAAGVVGSANQINGGINAGIGGLNGAINFSQLLNAFKQSQSKPLPPDYFVNLTGFGGPG